MESLFRGGSRRHAQQMQEIERGLEELREFES